MDTPGYHAQPRATAVRANLPGSRTVDIRRHLENVLIELWQLPGRSRSQTLLRCGTGSALALCEPHERNAGKDTVGHQEQEHRAGYPQQQGQQ